jgi:YHS domain-containing protein
MNSLLLYSFRNRAGLNTRRSISWLPVLLALILSTAVQANEPVFAPDSVALNGYDVVAYFTQGEPVKGDPVLAHRWQGVDWFFSSESHRDLFAENPEKYAPKYGGFCALGAAHGGLVPSSPRAWSIHNDELIMNMNQDVVETWRYNPDTNIERADHNWPALRDRFIASKVAQ